MNKSFLGRFIPEKKKKINKEKKKISKKVKKKVK